MEFPNFSEEKKCWRQGFDVVVGLDEAGRGPLAGPVVAAAVSVKLSSFKVLKLKGLENTKDSKQLSAKKREELYEILTTHPAIGWGIGIVSEKVIDKINILEATKLAMQKAVTNLSYNYRDRDNCKTIDFLLIDGNFAINSSVRQKSIIKGDQKVFSIAAASIIAKVTRDRIMEKMRKKYPEYGFDAHKGYGTALHVKNLQQFGPCKIHRKSFRPVSDLSSTTFAKQSL